MSNRAERRAGMSSHRIIKKMAGEWTPFEEREITAEHRVRYTIASRCMAVLVNNRYVVQLYERSTDWGIVLHLAVRRNDGEMASSWSDLQRIKNEIAGEERVALQVFPPEGELVDDANMAHLWVLRKDFVLPFTLKGGW